jgi:quinol monooxygenase YgiN
LELAVLGRPSDEEALRIVIAFCCIMEPEKRAELLQLAETFARQSTVVDGCTHFSLLDRGDRRRDVDNERLHGVFANRKTGNS